MFTNQEIGGLLFGALGGWLIAKRRLGSEMSADAVCWACIGAIFGFGGSDFIMKNDAVTVTSVIGAIVTALFGFFLFWRLLGGIKGKGVLALAMVVVPALLFLIIPSFPNFSEPVLQIISTAALGLCAGASTAWAVMEVKR